jgi:hypothetical protein
VGFPRFAPQRPRFEPQTGLPWVMMAKLGEGGEGGRAVSSGIPRDEGCWLFAFFHLDVLAPFSAGEARGGKSKENPPRASDDNSDAVCGVGWHRGEVGGGGRLKFGRCVLFCFVDRRRTRWCHAGPFCQGRRGPWAKKRVINEKVVVGPLFFCRQSRSVEARQTLLFSEKNNKVETMGGIPLNLGRCASCLAPWGGHGRDPPLGSRHGKFPFLARAPVRAAGDRSGAKQ